MNGHIKPTQNTESKPEITEPTMQQLPDNELDAITGGYSNQITFSGVLISSVLKTAENNVFPFSDLIVSS